MPERAILGCLLQDNSLIAECPLSDSDFTEDSHQEIYRQIQTMAMQRSPFDAVTLADRMTDTTGRQGWVSILGKLLESSPAIENFTVYADIVKAKATNRRASDIGKALAESGDADKAITQLMGLKQAAQRGGKVLNAVNFAIDAVERIEQGGNPGVMTGLKDLDGKLGGLHNSDLIIVAGRPSMGKTAVMLNMANGSDAPAGIISGEQSMEQIGQRFLALNGNLSVHKMRNGTLDQSDWKRAAGVISHAAEQEIYICDKPSITLADIQREGRRWKHQYGIRILYVDYLQKIIGTKDNKREEVSEVVIGLKNLARELDIPVVALAQVNRNVENDKNKRPYMVHLAESGVIEREADQVMTLYRDEVYNDNGEAGVMEIILCKNRHGPMGTVKVTWIAEYMQVKDYAQTWGTP